MFKFKLIDTRNNKVIWQGKANTPLAVVKQFDLAGVSQQHLKLIQTLA